MSYRLNDSCVPLATAVWLGCSASSWSLCRTLWSCCSRSRCWSGRGQSGLLSLQTQTFLSQWWWLSGSLSIVPVCPWKKRKQTWLMKVLNTLSRLFIFTVHWKSLSQEVFSFDSSIHMSRCYFTYLMNMQNATKIHFLFLINFILGSKNREIETLVWSQLFRKLPVAPLFGRPSSRSIMVVQINWIYVWTSTRSLIKHYFGFCKPFGGEHAGEFRQLWKYWS